VQTKTNFCTRLANQKVPGRPGQHVSYPNSIDIRQRYDSGQWNIPCYTMQCVGYDMALYDALAVTAANILHCKEAKTQSLGKRRRTETPSVCGLGDESAKGEGSIKSAQVNVTPDGVGEAHVKGE
jgi:hypothetical protein